MAQRKSNKKKALMGTAMVALSALPARYAIASTVNVDIQAIVVTSAIAVFQNQSLNFGTFTTGGAGGTVDITPAGGVTYTGVVGTPSTAPTEAIIQVKGKTHAPGIDISVTDPTVTISNGPTQKMVVDQFNINTNAGGPAETGIPITAPSVFVPIGATLTVGVGAAAGTYTGTFTVQVAYQ